MRVHVMPFDTHCVPIARRSLDLPHLVQMIPHSPQSHSSGPANIPASGQPATSHPPQIRTHTHPHTPAGSPAAAGATTQPTVGSPGTRPPPTTAGPPPALASQSDFPPLTRPGETAGGAAAGGGGTEAGATATAADDAGAATAVGGGDKAAAAVAQEPAGEGSYVEKAAA